MSIKQIWEFWRAPLLAGFFGGWIIAVIGLGSLTNENTELKTRITVIQTQLADTKESQKQADYRLKLCMERK